MDDHRDEAVLFLGGVPMITSDSIEFIRSDLKVFGVGVILFIVTHSGRFFPSYPLGGVTAGGLSDQRCV